MIFLQNIKFVTFWIRYSEDIFTEYLVLHRRGMGRTQSVLFLDRNGQRVRWFPNSYIYVKKPPWKVLFIIYNIIQFLSGQLLKSLRKMILANLEKARTKKKRLLPHQFARIYCKNLGFSQKYPTNERLFCEKSLKGHNF